MFVFQVMYKKRKKNKIPEEQMCVYVCVYTDEQILKWMKHSDQSIVDGSEKNAVNELQKKNKNQNN